MLHFAKYFRLSNSLFLFSFSSFLPLQGVECQLVNHTQLHWWLCLVVPDMVDVEP